MPSKTRSVAKNGKRVKTSMCKGIKTVSKCKKMKGCRRATGKVRSYCRKSKNVKKSATTTKKALKRTRAERLIDSLKGRRSDKTIRELRRLN
jgi:hypothetical protein